MRFDIISYCNKLDKSLRQSFLFNLNSIFLRLMKSKLISHEIN